MNSPRQISSMTGYGRASISGAGVRVDVEIKSVNHRFLDLNARLPREYLAFESDVRAELGKFFSRGRIDLFVTRVPDGGGRAITAFNRKRFDELLSVYRQAMEAAGMTSEVQSSTGGAAVFEILRRSDVLESPDACAAGDDERAVLGSALRAAGEAALRMRLDEGGRLRKDLETRLACIAGIESRIAKAVVRDSAAEIRSLRDRVAKLVAASQIDESRLALEVAILADRCDVTEELVRLRSHLEQFRFSLDREPSGKRFDFLLQEIGREMNTIASKAQDAAVQNLVIDGKLEIEKMREQTQNIE